jgi:hypothetical protein
MLRGGRLRSREKAVDDLEEEYRTVDGHRDTSLAEINADAGQELITITNGLDELGDGAVGGLPYLIARSAGEAKKLPASGWAEYVTASCYI